jgi:hypothetical protein
MDPPDTPPIDIIIDQRDEAGRGRSWPGLHGSAVWSIDVAYATTRSWRRAEDLSLGCRPIRSRLPERLVLTRSPAMRTTLLNLNSAVCCHCRFYRPPSWLDWPKWIWLVPMCSELASSLAEGDFRGHHREGSKAFRAGTIARDGSLIGLLPIHTVFGAFRVVLLTD